MDSAALLTIASLFVDQLKNVWLFFAGGIVFAAVIKTFKWDRKVRASLVRYERSAIFVAVGAGLIAPLCSCGILPVVISLSAAGVPLPPVVALLITSPLMSPDAFLLTLGQLGWTYALWKLVTATVIGLVAGFGALVLVRRGWLPSNSFRVEAMYRADGRPRPGFEEIVHAGCFGPPEEGGHIVEHENRFRFFLDRLRDMTLVVGKYLLAALVIQAVVTYYLPANLIEPYLGRESAIAILLASVISIPLPLTQVMAPSIIKGFLASGMSAGAGMAMLIGGPVTSIPAISALAALYDRRVLVLYLGIGVSSTLAIGYLFQAIHG